jgi:hypothetical protein
VGDGDIEQNYHNGYKGRHGACPFSKRAGRKPFLPVIRKCQERVPDTSVNCCGVSRRILLIPERCMPKLLKTPLGGLIENYDI